MTGAEKYFAERLRSASYLRAYRDAMDNLFVVEPAITPALLDKAHQLWDDYVNKLEENADFRNEENSCM